jgi:ABC-type polysaccharide/polyol phosphate export permease
MSADTVEATPSVKVAARKKIPVYRSSRSRFRAAYDDIADGLSLWSMWVPLTFSEIFGQFRRFALGVAWIPLGMVLVAYMLGLVYSQMLGRDYWDYSLYLLAGFTFWQFIQTSVLSGFGLFSKQASMINNVSLPFSYYIFKFIFEAFVNLMIVLPFVFIVAAFHGKLVSLEVLMIFPAILVYILTGIGVAFFMSILSVRVRDLESPLSSFMRVMFLVTPIIWQVDQMQGSMRMLIATYNPFYHILEIARAPMLGEMATAVNWYVSLGVMGTFLVLSVFMFARARHRIHYWL